MTRYLGQGVAERLGELVGLPEEDKAVIAYGLEQVIANSITLAVTLLAGYLLRLLPETVVIISCLTIMRRLVGGAHCSTPWRCTITTCLLILGTALASRAIMVVMPAVVWVGVAAAWSLPATWRWAPNDSDKKPIRNPVRRRQLRRRALVTETVLFSLFFYLAVSGSGFYSSLAGAGAGGIAVNAFTTSPLGHQIVNFFDHFLGFMTRYLSSRGGEIL